MFAKHVRATRSTTLVPIKDPSLEAQAKGPGAGA